MSDPLISAELDTGKALERFREHAPDGARLFAHIVYGEERRLLLRLQWVIVCDGVGFGDSLDVDVDQESSVVVQMLEHNATCLGRQAKLSLEAYVAKRAS